jgi:hypothetical protein
MKYETPCPYNTGKNAALMEILKYEALDLKTQGQDRGSLKGDIQI